MNAPLGLQSLAEAYTANPLSKHDFIEAMARCHASWFEYADFLDGSDVRAIEIHRGRVVLVTEAVVRFVVDPTYRRQAVCEALHFRNYENMDAAMLYALAPTRGVVFDIGANRGWYSLNLAKRSPEIQVHAFEPVPHTFAALNENIQENATANVTPYPFGFSNVNGAAEFFFTPGETGAASGVDLLSSPHTRSVKVQLRKLDDFVAEWGGVIDFIKCDVEGAELFVFQGALRTLETRPIIFCETLRNCPLNSVIIPIQSSPCLPRRGIGVLLSMEVDCSRFRMLKKQQSKPTSFSYTK